MTCNCHARELESKDYIVRRALTILKKGREVMLERDKSYNTNDIGFADYRINGLDSCLEEIVENVVRLWNCKDDDKVIDLVNYVSLMAGFIQEGMPVSRFHPIIQKHVTGLRKAIKQDDIDLAKSGAETCNFVDVDYPEQKVV